MKLSEQRCEPCETGGIPLSHDEAKELHKQVPRWSLKEKKLTREFQFDDFRAAMDFVNQIADIAESQGHHPDIYIYYNKVDLVLTTHKIGGLSQNDFIMAAKIDELVEMPDTVTI